MAEADREGEEFSGSARYWRGGGRRRRGIITGGKKQTSLFSPPTNKKQKEATFLLLVRGQIIYFYVSKQCRRLIREITSGSSRHNLFLPLLFLFDRAFQGLPSFFLVGVFLAPTWHSFSLGVFLGNVLFKTFFALTWPSSRGTLSFFLWVKARWQVDILFRRLLGRKRPLATRSDGGHIYFSRTQRKKESN